MITEIIEYKLNESPDEKKLMLEAKNSLITSKQLSKDLSIWSLQKVKTVGLT